MMMSMEDHSRPTMDMEDHSRQGMDNEDPSMLDPISIVGGSAYSLFPTQDQQMGLGYDAMFQRVPLFKSCDVQSAGERRNCAVITDSLKRPRTAYNFYSRDMFGKLKAENSSRSSTEIIQLVGCGCASSP